MNDERTIYDEQRQAHGDTSSLSEEQKSSISKEGDSKKKQTWRRVAAGAGAGFAMGAAATVLSSSASPDIISEEGTGATEVTGGTDHPAWVDDEVGVATSVNDSMSFGEAFQAARAEVGPGGVFEWHGQLYNTFYAEEWNQMTAEERAEFGSHFNWSEHHSNYVANTHHTEIEDVAVVTVDPDSGDGDTTQQPENPEGEAVQTSIINDDPEVQILGIVHDSDADVNMGAMLVDGHEAVVLDVDGDMTFDIMGVDVNDNHQFDENEIADISNGGLTVDDMGGFTPMDDTLQESDNLETLPDVYEC